MCVSISSQVDRHVELFSEAEDCKRVSKPANADFGETTAVAVFKNITLPAQAEQGIHRSGYMVVTKLGGVYKVDPSNNLCGVYKEDEVETCEHGEFVTNCEEAS